MEFLWAITIGLVVGMVARMIPGSISGLFLTLAIAVMGATVATLVARLFGLLDSDPGLALYSSTIGAVLTLAAHRMTRGPGARA